MRSKSLIQPSDTLPIELTKTHIFSLKLISQAAKPNNINSNHGNQKKKKMKNEKKKNQVAVVV